MDKEVDYPLALGFFFLAGFSVLNAVRETDLFARIEILASVPINVMGGVAFVIRDPAIEQTSSGEYIVPVLSFVLPFFVMNNIIFFPVAYSYSEGIVLAIPGMLLAVASIYTLRKSFAVLPAVRSIVARGPYRYIRHPAYLGELVFVFGIMLLAFNVMSIVIYVATLGLTLWRIDIEERKLSKSPQYSEYMTRVKYRLVPGLF